MSIYDLNTSRQEYVNQFYQTLLNVLKASTSLVNGSVDLTTPRLTLIAMVKVKIDELMAESEGLEIDLSSSDNTNILDMYINALLDESAINILQQAPLNILIPATGNVELSGLSEGDTAGFFFIPGDFLRFKSFKISGWLQTVTELHTTDHYSYKNQRFSRLRSGATKPMAYMSASVKTNMPIKQVETLTFTGASGSATITGPGGLAKDADYSGSLANTASVFVANYGAAYLEAGIDLTVDGAKLIFAAHVAGTPFDHVGIITTSGDLSGDIVRQAPNVPEKEPKRTIEYYSDPTKAHILAEFLYIARVGAEHVQENLFPALTWLCAAKVLQIWGEFSGNASYSQRAMEQVKLCLDNLQ